MTTCFTSKKDFTVLFISFRYLTSMYMTKQMEYSLKKGFTYVS